jgi:hypothetical protein
MLIALNIILAAAVAGGVVALILHAIRLEHRDRTQVAGALHAETDASRLSLDHRVASTGAPTRRVARSLSASRG